MKTLKSILVLSFLITIFNCSNTNNTNDEQQIRDIIAQYDQATINRDVDFFEKMFASDYTAATINGGLTKRATALKELKEEKEDTSWKMLELKTDSLEVKISGDIAIASGIWSSSVIATDDLNSEPHNDKGRYTCILEKRKNQWTVIKEHITEKPHDKDVLEAQLKKASIDYDQAMLNKDSKLYASLLADDYTSINDTGIISDKTTEVERMTSPDLVFTDIETTEKDFRLYRNTAIETGKYNSQGMYKGKPISETGRYTATWVYRDGKWKIVAEQSSPISK